MSSSAQTIINTLCTRMGWSTSSAPHRLVALACLNRAERWMSQQGSFLYLSKRTTLALNNSASSAAAPADFDYGKAAVIAHPTEGPLEFKKLGEFDSMSIRTGGNLIATDRPSYWTFAFNVATATIYFTLANTSGSTITFNFTYQRTVADLTDGSGSFSLLPFGYEDTILTDKAEFYAKKDLGIPMQQRFIEDLDAQTQAFFSAQRTTKDDSRTDMDIQSDKQYEAQLRPGV